jgi:hypothetical protein
MQLIAVSEAPIFELTEQEIGEVSGGNPAAVGAVAAVAAVGGGIVVGALLVAGGFALWHYYR